MAAAYVINTIIISITEEKRVIRGRVVGGQTALEEASLGWFILFDGSHEKLFIGWEKPADLNPGDKVKITISKEG